MTDVKTYHMGDYNSVYSCPVHFKSSEILEDVVMNQSGHCYKLFTGSSITIITHIIKPEYNSFFWNTSYFDKPTKQDRITELSLLHWIKLHVYEVWLLDENQT